MSEPTEARIIVCLDGMNGSPKAVTALIDRANLLGSQGLRFDSVETGTDLRDEAGQLVPNPAQDKVSFVFKRNSFNVSGYKVVCKDCGWRGHNGDLLQATSPFDPEIELYACPGCKVTGEIRTACDEEGCWYQDTMGTPTSTGYRRTCYEHAPVPFK